MNVTVLEYAGVKLALLKLARRTGLLLKHATKYLYISAKTQTKISLCVTKVNITKCKYQPLAVIQKTT